MIPRLLAVLCAALALPAAAQIATPRVDQRQENQGARIQQGVQSGALNGKEAARLESGQARVQAQEAKAKADGKVTPKEKARLARAQNKQGRKITKQKHDARKKAPAG